MSSSTAIAIPQRRRKQSRASGSTNASPANNSFTYGSYGSVRNEDGATTPKAASERRPSLMSPAFSRAEHTVVNIGNSDMPRLVLWPRGTQDGKEKADQSEQITCVKASQGFDWNQEIFLPSYANFDFDDLERKQDPVEEIVVTDEERAKMFPS
ncbi:uncharacterized protein N0V89_010455 [Didymosphaeria variabile]|uniref:Uncharacterized protein n=1 Tax=Didymosphaeria variabile TaxID=1932322 RepID=A0A9W8XBB0_9PLEO|nr:uncharacterized protein N0V89_010455 [Didymosphaeria variabile]KAJ4346524.1 hypothetical protein N0V89_010455 [Didymosphaeria variabile]